MSLILDGTNGLSDIDGSAATPAIRGTDANTGIFFPAADTIAFAEGGAEVARFNADSQFVAAAGTAALPVFTTTGDVNTGIFFPAADTIAFAEGGAEAARIDSSGNLGIGTSSPEANAKLTVKGAGIAVSKDSSTVTPSGFDLKCRSSNPQIGLHVTGTAQLAQIEFGTAGDNSFGALINVTGADPLRFGTNNTERARIDSSGNLLVGLTSVFNGTNCPLQVSNSAANQVSALRNTNANPFGIYVNYSAATPNSAQNEFLYCNDSSALRMSARSNGGIANYSANNVNLSDRREKINFTPATSYLAKICAIPVQTFNYIDQNLEEDGGLTLGVIAQDVQAVAPEMVMESNWGTEEEPKMRLSIYQTDLQYALMKCIQEQQVLITTLTQRITALEAKS